MSAYFSAIMSTADSCLMAASGNLMTDIIGRFRKKLGENMFLTQIVTFLIGVIAMLLALLITEVLELMLYSYAFMVSGLLVPVLMMLFHRKPNSNAAFGAMICGGSVTLILIFSELKLPFGLDANFFGILSSFLVYVVVHRIQISSHNSDLRG